MINGIENANKLSETTEVVRYLLQNGDDDAKARCKQYNTLSNAFQLEEAFKLVEGLHSTYKDVKKETYQRSRYRFQA